MRTRPPPADYPLIAQFIRWTALAALAATWCDRTRYANLNGAFAAPINDHTHQRRMGDPPLSRLFDTSQAHPDPAVRTWYLIAACATAGSRLAIRDQWHRYTRPITAR